MSFFNMNCKINIGRVSFNICNKIEITKSIFNPSYTAKIYLPREFKDIKGQNILEYIKIEDKVIIELGYNEDYITELEGYVTNIGAEKPLLIECENECFNLRKKVFNKTFSEVKLSELLNYIGIKKIEIQGEDKKLGKYIIQNANAYDVLKNLKEQHLLFSFFREDKLVITPLAKELKNIRTVKYEIGKNTRDKGSLKYLNKEGRKLFIRLVSNQKGGGKISYQKGEEGGTRIESQRPSNYTLDMLKNEVEELYNQKNVDAFEGSISAFGIPYVEVGDHVILVDDDASKKGTYMVEGIDVVFSENGFERKIKLGIKIL